MRNNFVVRRSNEQEQQPRLQRFAGSLGSIAPAANSIAPTADGYLLIDQAKFPADFAADLPAAEAQFMAISQVPINGSALGTPITAPAWKTKPSYGIVATQDRMINPDLERSMYKRAGAKVTEIKGSHARLPTSSSRLLAARTEDTAAGGVIPETPQDGQRRQ